MNIKALFTASALSTLAAIELMENESVEEFSRKISNELEKWLMQDGRFSEYFKVSAPNPGAYMPVGIVSTNDSTVVLKNYGVGDKQIKFTWERDDNGNFTFGDGVEVVSKTIYEEASKKRRFKSYSECDIESNEINAAIEASGDTNIELILTHVGANSNGDVFLPDELEKATDSIVGQKIDMSHDQNTSAIVGKVTEAEYVDDGDDSRVQCKGVLFSSEFEAAKQAATLIKNEIIAHVSMECEYEYSECSVCGNKAYSPGDFCNHIKKYKGRAYRGKVVNNIMHNIEFTGLGLLDKKGADERAKIQLAAEKEMFINYSKGEKEMSVKTDENKTGKAGEGVNINIFASEGKTEKTTDQKDEEVKTESTKSTEAAEAANAENANKVAELVKQVAELQKENESLKEKVSSMEKEKSTAARKVAIADVIGNYTKAGRKFDEEAKVAEEKALMEMSEEAFNATANAAKSIADSMPEVEAEAEADDEDNTSEAALTSEASKNIPKRQGKTASSDDVATQALKDLMN